MSCDMDSALNLAHQHERKAELLLKARKFDDAILCHQKTSELLAEAMNLTKAERALESIQLQRDYHIRVQAIIRYKQSLFEKRQVLFQRLLKMAAAKQNGRPTCEDPTAEDIQHAIYRNIEENDSLLQFLKRDGDTVFQLATGSNDKVLLSAVKAPKDDKTIIEELQVNNDELRQLISNLIVELDEKRAENERLKIQIEEMKAKIESYELESNKIGVITDSCSPYVFSPSSELSPVGIQNLPPLAPLEMPNFDFNKLDDSASSEN